MIKALIVDDELEIRKGLYLKVDWQQLGFEITAEAIHGADALTKLAEQSVDVVFTDMSMPVMDGVTLLSQIQERYPTIKLVVLTGYDDFAYTRAAIRHRAIEYLLKPIMPDELEHTLIKIKAEIDKERQEKMTKQESNRWQQQWLKEIRENFALNMLKGNVYSIIVNKAPQIHMGHWNEAVIQVLAVGLHEKSSQSEQFHLPFELLVRELADQYADQALVCKDSNYPALIYMIIRDGSYSHRHLMQQLQEQLKQHLPIELVLGVSGEVTGFAQWHSAYMDSLLQWSLNNSGLHQASAIEGHISKLDDEVLTRLIDKNELESVLHYIRTSLSDANKRSNTEFVKRIFEVLIKLERVWQGKNTYVKHAVWLNPEQVLKLTSVEKALSYIEQYLKEGYVPTKQERGDDIFAEVLYDIQQNYVYEITLPMLAEKYNYNTSYFSELFKIKVGKSFVQYLNDLRMKRACHLLETTDLSLSDIAELTGFSNASYFSSRFKKAFNISPSEYRVEKGTEN